MAITGQERCEHCGQPATMMAKDTVEIVSRGGDFGGVFREWEATDTHFYCDGHARRGEMRYLDGHTAPYLEAVSLIKDF